MKRLLTSLLVMAALLISPSYAQEALFPNIPKALGAPHPEGNAFWRINHPALLRHDRDLTVLKGIREIDASLAGCVACHAVNGPDLAPVNAESPQFFCQVCHQYVAVKIDCFMCHSATPDPADYALVLPAYGGTPESLAAYLERLAQ